MALIAIIDDDPDIVEATSLILQSKGYATVTASNIEEGYALVTGQKPDLVILDVMMIEPDDGFYLANKLRRDGYDVPIVMLTSVSKAFGYAFGSGGMVPVNEFLEKPVTPAVLLEKIEKHLHGAKVSSHA